MRGDHKYVPIGKGNLTAYYAMVHKYVYTTNKKVFVRNAADLKYAHMINKSIIVRNVENYVMKPSFWFYNN